MTDKELLELVAKAAGIEIAFADGPDRDPVRAEEGTACCVPWNPITDDGDALRLAVKLDLHVGKSAMGPQRFAGRHDFDTPGCSFYEPENADPYAATRRAIVRAAAEVGRGAE